LLELGSVRRLAILMLLLFAAPVGAAPIGGGLPRTALKQALALKKSWRARGELLMRGAALEAEHVAALEDQLRTSHILPVDAARGPRAVQPPATVRIHVEALHRELAGLLPAETQGEIRELVDRALEHVRGRKLYARAGLHGLADLLEDELISGAVARTPEDAARLAIAAEAVHLAARNVSVHALGEGLQPPEVKYALKKDPGLADLVARAQAEGVDIAFRRSEQTPPEALAAIERIAIISQGRFQQTWLPQLVRSGNMPKLTFGEGDLQRARSRELIAEDASEAEVRAQLERDVATIRQTAGRMMGFAVGPGAPRGLEARLERALDALRVEHALGRMIFDDANRRTSGAQEIVKKMVLVGPLAHLFEHFGHGAIAKLFAGTADDLLNEAVEIGQLYKSGFTKAELAKRFYVNVPVLAAATYGASQVEHLQLTGHAAAAGELFGASAVALSFSSALQSIAMYKAAYDSLLREGKIEGKIGPLAGDPRFQKVLRELDHARELVSPAGRETLLREVKTHLEGLGSAISEQEKAAVLDTLAHLDLAQIDAQVRSPAQLMRWKAAVKQDFSNPTRFGLLLGAALAPLVGAAAAKAGLLNNGFVLAAVGSVESVTGGLMVRAARRLNDWKHQRAVEREIAALGR
jgi:hypothetical protein